MRRVRGPAAAVFALALLVVGGAGGAVRARPLLVVPRLTRPGLDSQLVQVSDAQRRGGEAQALATAKAEGLGVKRNLVQVIVEARDGQLAGAEDAVTRAGGNVTGAADGLIEALVSPEALAGLGTDSAVARVRPPDHMVLETVDEGVAATN